jgi:hypothetical protein
MAEAAQPTAFTFDFDEFNLKDISLDTGMMYPPCTQI